MTKWSTKKLGEVCVFQGGLWKGKKPPFTTISVLRNVNFRIGGMIDYDDVATLDVESRQLEKRKLKEGDILLERSGGGPTQPVGRVVMFQNSGDYSFSNFTTRMRVADPSQVDPHFLLHFLDSLYLSGYTESLQKLTTGIRNLKFDEYKLIEIPLPPLPEQRRIVKKIEEVEEKVKELIKTQEDSLHDLEALMPSVLAKAFQGDL